ncbi:hypothetical protein BC834DRAFT_971423 [Gloeopeniophorella convolvens]|nr:hypothetical protein BC834DRAFT_971423 [Gloeopeniophorella convolvens]
MSSAPDPKPTMAIDSMRLPAYRASYLYRYHPYPRTRIPARELVMLAAAEGSQQGSVVERNTEHSGS